VIPDAVLRQVPSIALARVSRDEPPQMETAGWSSIAKRTPATPETAYHWFSMTKLVTATATVQLSERGVVDLDAPVEMWFPPFSEMRPRELAKQVTPRHLLSHSSGLANPIPLSWVHLSDKPGPDTETFLRDLLRRHRRLRFSPGAHTSYSNLGYLLLGQVIARASGLSYEEYVRRHVLDPLAMDRTRFPGSPDRSGIVATGYHARWSLTSPFLRFLVPRGILDGSEGRFRSFRPFDVHGPSYAGLVGPVGDAARFLQMHLRDGELGGTRILAEDSARRMRDVSTRGSRIDVGLGWFRPARSRRETPTFVEHLGGALAFFGDMRAYPSEGFGVVVMGNATRYDYESVIRSARHVSARPAS